MKVSEFKDVLDDLSATNSLNDKKAIIGDIDDPAAISFLSGSEFDDAGLGKKTVLGVAQDVFGESISGKPTVSESLESEDSQIHHGHDLYLLREDMNRLADMSGNDQKQCLKEMFEFHEYPSVVAHACLNDYPTGCGDSTIAKALGLKECLPFVEGIVQAAEMEAPPSAPVVGQPFAPMLAKSSSSLPEDLSDHWAQPKLDGYRIIIHIKQEETGPQAYAFTRPMNDVTESLPELNEIDWSHVGEAIFDGEVIAEDGTYKSTSERVGRSAENVEREQEMEFGLFDCIVADGDAVWDQPYRQRHADLCCAPINSDKVYTLSAQDLTREEAVEMGRDYEGVIWKDPSASYKFDKRSTGWIKEKNTAETVDVLAVDFEEGQGRLDGTLGKVTLESVDGEPVGKTGSGFSDEQRDKVWNNKEKYINQPLEVEAEAYQDKLRFPIFQRWRLTDGEADPINRIEEVLPEP